MRFIVFTLTRWFTSLRARLFLLVLLAVVPMLGLILYTDLEQRQRDLAQVEADALHISRLAANAQQDLLADANHLLTILALLPQIQGDDPVECNDLLARILKQDPQYANIAVAQLNGDVFCSGVPVAGQVSFSERAVFKRALETRGFVVGGYEIGLITKRPILSIAYPLLDSSGRVQRVVIAGLDLTWLNQVAANIQLLEGSRITLIDREGMVLARYPDAEDWVGKSASDYAIVQTILARGEGTAEGIGLDNLPRLFAFTLLNSTTDTGAYLFISIPRASAFAAQDATLARNLTALLVVTVIAFALAWMGSRRFVLRDIRMLVQATRQIAAGDLRARATFASGIDELGELARHFDAMADALEQRDARQKQIEAALRESESKYRIVADNTYDWEFWLDASGRFVYLSPSCERISGYTADEFNADADLFSRIVHPDDRALFDAHRHTAKQGIALSDLDIRIVHRDGTTRWISHVCQPVFDDAGNFLGTRGSNRGISKRKRAEQELQAERDFVLQVVNAMGQGLTVTDAEGCFVFVNPAYARMTGYTVQDLIGKRPRDVTMPEDHATLARARAERALGKTTTYETRFLHADGSHVHASITAVPRASTGQYAGAIAVVTDLTERMRMEQAVRESESLYHSLIEALPISLCRKDLENKFVFANSRYCEEFGKVLSDIVGKNDYDLHPPELAEKYREDDRRVIESGETLDTIEEHQPLGGAKTFVQAIKTPWRDSRGNVVGIQIIYWDVTERVLAEQQLVHASSHDALTGLYNRTYFEQELARLEHSRQFPVSVVMADVDGLKRVNDQHGHIVGDDLLKRAAVVLAAAFRTEDIVARIGGDEFAVLLPATDADTVAEAVRRIRKILSVPHTTRAGTLLELSIGVATASRGTALSEAIKQADAQMYREKEEHRQENDK